MTTDQLLVRIENELHGIGKTLEKLVDVLKTGKTEESESSIPLCRHCGGSLNWEMKEVPWLGRVFVYYCGHKSCEFYNVIVIPPDV